MNNLIDKIHQTFSTSEEYYLKTIQSIIFSKAKKLGLSITKENLFTELSIKKVENSNKSEVWFNDLKILELENMSTINPFNGNITIEIKHYD